MYFGQCLDVLRSTNELLCEVQVMDLGRGEEKSRMEERRGEGRGGREGREGEGGEVRGEKGGRAGQGGKWRGGKGGREGKGRGRVGRKYETEMNNY